MSEKHVAVCDGCRAEKALKGSPVTSSGMSVTGMLISGVQFSKPDGWHLVSGKDFCSWGCIARYAEGQSDG